MITHTNSISIKNWDVVKTEMWLIKLWRDNNWMKQDVNKLFQLLSCMIFCAEHSRNKETLNTIEEIFEYINTYCFSKIDESNPLIFTMTYHHLNRIDKIPNRFFQEGALRVRENLKNIQGDLKDDEKVFFLMDRYNLVTEEQTIQFVRSKIIDDTRFLLLDAEDIEKQLYLWFLCTSLGERKVLPNDLKQSSENIKILLSGCLLAECQKYQLILVSLLLRTMNYLSYESELLIEGTDFLCFQQRFNGSFGYLNPITSKKNQLTENINIDFHLPTLYEILWTFSDIIKDKSEQKNNE